MIVLHMSDLEAEFLNRYRQLEPTMPPPTHDYCFSPDRKWRFDFAWIEQRVAVELEGAVYIQGRHTRGKGFENDCDKYNAAQLAGWRVLRFTRGMLRNDPTRCINVVTALIDPLPFTGHNEI